MINPVIESFSDNEEEDIEGCLSIPEFFEKVVRPAEIQVRYYDLEMKEHRDVTNGFLARVMQHEIDHLEGILFFDRMTPLRRALSRSKLKKIERGDIETSYPMILKDGKLKE
jgi:peptide deformylase